MSDAATIRVDPRDYRLDGRLARRIWKLAKPYWAKKEHWKSWVLVMFGILIGPAWAFYNFRIAQITADQANWLVGKDESQFLSIFWLLFFLGLGKWVYDEILQLLNMLLHMHWYRWMTDWMVARYLGNKTYYDIGLKDDVDNPDERIQTNVDPFVLAVVSFPTKVLGTILGIATNGVLLTQVTSTMTLFVVVYSTIGLVLQTVI